MTSTIDLLAGATTPPESGNFIARIEELERRVESLTTRTRSVNSLDEFAADLGMIQYGEFRSGNDREPGDGFSGSRIGYPGFLYNSEEYAWALVNEDVLEIGFSLTSKKAVFASGNATIGADGIIINQMSYLIQHTATDGVTERTGSLGMWAEPGGTAPQYGIAFNAPGGTELVTNGDASAGDTSGWTKTQTIGSSWSVVSGKFRYYAGISVGTHTGTFTQNVSISELTPYIFTISYEYGILRTFTTKKCELKWKDSGSSVLRTDTILFSASTLYTLNATSPSDAVSVDIVITFETTLPEVYAYIDSISLKAVSVASNLYFDSTGELKLNDDPLLPMYCYISSLVMTSSATLSTIAGNPAYKRTTAANASDGNTFTIPVPQLSPGTYSIYFCGAKQSDRGKLDWTLDGASIVTGQDWYGTQADYVYQVDNIIIGNGTHELVGTINGKNASSTDYTVVIYSWVFVKTA